MITWTEWLTDKLKPGPYAAYHGGLESVFVPELDDALLELPWPILGQPHIHRIPKDGDTLPINNDGPINFHPELIGVAGTNWWDYQKGLTEACAFDFDFGHGGNAQDAEGIAQIDRWADRLPYMQNATSKGGRGRHWLGRLTTPLPATVRSQHVANCRAIMQKVSADLGIELTKYVCSYGVIQYIYARKPATGGLQLIKAATDTLTVSAPAYMAPIKRASLCNTLTPEQQRIIDRIATEDFACGWDHNITPAIFRCHTAAVARAGFCETDSTGRNGNTPNAFIVAIDGGLLLKTWRRESGGDWYERDGKFCTWILDTTDSFDFILECFLQKVAS